MADSAQSGAIMDRNAAEERVLRLIAAYFRNEAKVEEGFPISFVKLTDVIRKCREATNRVNTSSRTMRSRWELGFAAILLSGRYMRRRRDLLVGRKRG
jgi:hypothetical protein